MIDNRVKEYWNDIDNRLEVLLEKGFVKLPSIKKFDLDSISKNIKSDMGSLTFKESCEAHIKFLNNLELQNYLTPKLFNLAKKIFSYKGELTNQYNIARKVEPGNSKEMYRAHFDSHLFTLITPIKIPYSQDNDKCGELIYFPNLRKNPKNEFSNIFSKIYYKRYASEIGLKKLSVLHQEKTENFKNYEPLLFLGKTTLHTNHNVSDSCNTYRLTLLTHFFDDTPKIGVGSLLRFLRRR